VGKYIKKVIFHNEDPFWDGDKLVKAIYWERKFLKWENVWDCLVYSIISMSLDADGVGTPRRSPTSSTVV